MKITVMKNGIVMGLFLALIMGNAFAHTNSKELVGTWNYQAPNAPYQYAKGKLIFTDNGEKLEGVIKLGSYEIKMNNLKVEKDNISFEAYVEGEYVTIKAKIDKKTLTGTAKYSEGTIEVKGEKE